jgi:Fe-S-cluster containining protein
MRLKELRRVIKGLERQGLPHEPAPVDIAALVAIVDGRLAAGAPQGRSSRVMKLLASLQDKSNKHAPGMAKTACKEGCHYCCDVYVSAQAPRLFAIADWLRANCADQGAVMSRLEEANKSIRGLDADARARAGLACPFLEDGKCGIYPVRPAGCRGYFSLSVEACIAGVSGETEEIPTPAHIGRLRGAYEQALSAVLYQWRLPTAHYELTHGVLVALAQPDAEERWYDGEDVFAAVGIDRADESIKPEIRRLEAGFWETLWAVARGDAVRGDYSNRFPDWCR